MGWYRKADDSLIFSQRDPAWVEGGIEIRCPGRFNKLFLILLNDHMPEPGMFMEIACADCAKDARKQNPKVTRALHYYNTSGTCVNTKIVIDD